MSANSVKKKVAQATQASSPGGASVTVEEAKAITAEARKGGVSAPERAVVQDLFDTAVLSRAARVELGTVLTGEGSLSSLIPADWKRALRAELETPGFHQLERFLGEETASGAKVYPPRAEVFAALAQTRLKDVKVVVIGQDPYPTAGNANGLAFSVAPGMKVPASLKNIYAGLAADVGTTPTTSGDLTPWARQGVLLLNTVLTVREGAPNSHKDKGWEALTEAMLRKVNEQEGPVVFLCFGNQARDMARALVDTSKHTILDTPHPSPINGKKFVNTVAAEKPFSRINDLLAAGGRGTITWQLPAS
jgi:uracil-DNA glycosylase